MKGGVYAGHYGISVDKEGFKELRDWMASLFNCWLWTLATLQEKRSRVGAIRFWGGSFHKPPPLQKLPSIISRRLMCPLNWVSTRTRMI